MMTGRSDSVNWRELAVCSYAPVWPHLGCGRVAAKVSPTEPDSVTMSLSLPLVGRLSLKSFGVGAVAAAVGSVVARPLLVSAVRTGYEVSDLATGAWRAAKAEAASLKTEALTQAPAGLESEVKQLRDEVATLRSQLSSKRGS